MTPDTLSLVERLEARLALTTTWVTGALINPDGPAAIARIRDLEQALAHIANGNHPAHSGKGYLMDYARQALTPDPEKKP